MNDQFLKILLILVAVAFLGIIIAYLIIRKMSNNSEYKLVKELKKGTKENKFSNEVLYQKLYMYYLKIPFLNRYTKKIRRRLEIINIQDEYLTRKQTAKILSGVLLVMIPIFILTLILNKNNLLLLLIVLVGEVFFIDTYIDSKVDKIDNKLLKQQVDFFADIRHAYHEVNMVDEAIYQVIQENEEAEISIQAQKIYEILNADDPETELEKYYDVAPNSYLKEFAGISYLTKEFGDREVKGASLYLKNLNDITRRNATRTIKKGKIRLHISKFIYNFYYSYAIFRTT